MASSTSKDPSPAEPSEKQDAPKEPSTSLLPAKLEEDDEFEDFPAEDWTEESSDLPSGNTHLWEESWDDDDTNEDFAQQLKEELKKTEASKK